MWELYPIFKLIKEKKKEPGESSSHFVSWVLETRFSLCICTSCEENKRELKHLIDPYSPVNGGHACRGDLHTQYRNVSRHSSGLRLSASETEIWYLDLTYFGQSNDPTLYLHWSKTIGVTIVKILWFKYMDMF